MLCIKGALTVDHQTSKWICCITLLWRKKKKQNDFHSQQKEINIAVQIFSICVYVLRIFLLELQGSLLHNSGNIGDMTEYQTDDVYSEGLFSRLIWKDCLTSSFGSNLLSLFPGLFSRGLPTRSNYLPTMIIYYQSNHENQILLFWNLTHNKMTSKRYLWCLIGTVGTDKQARVQIFRSAFLTGCFVLVLTPQMTTGLFRTNQSPILSSLTVSQHYRTGPNALDMLLRMIPNLPCTRPGVKMWLFRIYTTFRPPSKTKT